MLSELRKPAPSENVFGWFAAISPELLFVSVLTLAELSRGAELLRRKDARSAIALDHWIAEVRLKFAERILSVDNEVAECWARLSPQQPLQVIDGLFEFTDGLPLDPCSTGELGSDISDFELSVGIE